MRYWAWIAVLWMAGAACAQQAGELKTPDGSLDLANRPPPPKAFGEPGSRWWTAGAGIAHDWSEATDVNLFGAYGYFLAKNVEFSGELNAWYFNQHGRDAIGLNPAIVFRWHFYDEGPWTVYTDAGIGLLFASQEVPQGGTRFDFTPRVGLGFTRLLDPETGLRLLAGVRWHHISNARLQGAGDNPSRDALLFYAGIQFPF